jgi:hypothetical protein
MARTALSLPDEAKTLPLTFGFVDDFFGLNSALWTDVEGDAAGDVAIDADGVGGVVQCTVTTTNNEEAYTAGLENFKIQAGKPIELTGRLQFTEAATDDANIIFGLMDAWGANQLVDDGVGPKATFDGACFYKIDGGTRWRVRTSNGTAYTDTELNYTAGQAGYQTLRILIQPGHDGYAEVSYWIDQAGGNALVQCREYGATAREPDVKHRVLLASMTELAVGFGLKNGGANSEALNVDYVSCFQAR